MKSLTFGTFLVWAELRLGIPRLVDSVMREEIKHSRKFSVTQKQYMSTFNILAWSTRIANSQRVVPLLVIVTHPHPWNIFLLYHIWGDTIDVYLLCLQSVLSFKFLILQPRLWEHFSNLFSSSFFFLLKFFLKFMWSDLLAPAITSCW